LLHCAAISEALQCSTVFQYFCKLFKKFSKLFKLFATFLLLGAYSDLPKAPELLNSFVFSEALQSSTVFCAG
jgi:hypothetical protein